MPLKGSAAKRHRQSEKRRLRNKSVKTKVRTSTRKLIESVKANAIEDAQTQFKEVTHILDRAVSKGVLHRNTAARKKSRLHRLINSMG